MSGLLTLEPLPRTRRGWLVLVVAGALFLVAFALVTRFYDAEGGSVVTGGEAVPSNASGVMVQVEPLAVDANVNTARIRVSFGPQGTDLFDGQGRPIQNIRVTVTNPLQGPNEFKFPAGTSMGSREMVVALGGDTAIYPFDDHGSELLISADTYTKGSDGSIRSVSEVTLFPEAAGGVNGWDTTIDLTPDSGFGYIASFGFQRAFSTIVFVMVILVIAGVLAFLALVTGALVQADRRPAEAALLSWTAALIFALPALRNYMPNAPPFGASIDMYAYLWFIVAAGVAAVLVIFGWNGQRLAERHRLERERGLAEAASRTGGAHAT